MTFINKIKSVVMKESYDFDRPDTTLHNFHPQLLFCFAMNGVFLNKQRSIARFILPLFNFMVSVASTVFELINIWRGVVTEDYALASESFFYLVALGTIPLLYASILFKYKIMIDLIHRMNNDFIYISTLGSIYQKTFLKGQLLIWNLCCAWIVFTLFVAITFIGNTVVLLLYQCLLATQDEYTARPFIFAVWLPEDDPTRTPNYEMLMTFQISIIVVFLFTFGMYVYTQFHIFLHYYVLMDLINLELHSLFDGMVNQPIPTDESSYNAIKEEFKTKIKRIVDWHISVFDSVDNISIMYGPPLVYQVMFSSVAICLMAFQVADTNFSCNCIKYADILILSVPPVVIQLEHGQFNFLYAILWFGAILQLWIPCYLGTLMRDKAFGVGEACYNCGWETTPIGRLLRTDLTIIMLRAQQPLTIQYTGLPELTLETFSSIMSTSYSYFNMLRQSTK